MSNFWKRLRNSLFAPPDAAGVVDALPAIRIAPPSMATLPGYPTTFRPAAPTDSPSRPQLFDPALKHFPRAFRPGDPTFSNDEDGQRWVALRRLVTDHVLRAIAESEWGNHLVLRGSRLLKAWLGDEAREPGDLDWVVDPPTTSPDSGWGARLCAGVIDAVFAKPTPAGVELLRSGVATDNIWTYERAEGRRVVFPWRAAGLPGAGVQVDIVFRETIPTPDRRLPIPLVDRGCVSVRSVSAAQSLAWKLRWLAGDMYPQGKDLYDAVLLAERFELPFAVLTQTFSLGDPEPLPRTAAGLVGPWRVDWKNFQAEYPWIGGEAQTWQTRLEKALTPTFSKRPGKRDLGHLPDETELDPNWLTPTVIQLAKGIEAEDAYDRLPILADALQDAGCDDEELLHHCRCDGPHTRGCWVVDLVAGKNAS
ncbi:MAG: nucleotidyl transferase AbiEii/AbiGii toxin family protein [Gemmataceae bacterium]